MAPITTDTCPFCGNEFEIGAAACPTCDLPLLDADPVPAGVIAVGHAISSDYATGGLRCVTVAANQVEAEMLEDMLRSEGIPVIVRRSMGSDVPDFLAAGRRDILVPESGVETARALLHVPEPTAGVSAAPSPLALAAAMLAGFAFVAALVSVLVLLS